MSPLRWIGLCLLMCISSAAWSEAEDANPLFPIMQDSLWGYIDQTGKVAIEPQFDGADYFSEGLAPIKSGFGEMARYGFIDKTGKIVIKPKFREVQRFSEGLAAAATDGDKWGFIDKTGRTVIRPAFTSVGDFHNGLARTWTDVAETSVKLGLIDKTGKLILETEPMYCEGYHEFGYIDDKGKLDMDRRALASLRFSEGLAIVPDSEEYARLGYVDTRGRVVIKPMYTCAKDFSEGLAPVSDDVGKWGYVDKTGKFVIEPQYDDAESFSNGLALVRTYGEQERVDTRDGDVWSRSERYSFIDKTGRVVLDLRKYHYGESFRDGLARIWIVSPELGGAPSYMDKTGKFIWKAE